MQPASSWSRLPCSYFFVCGGISICCARVYLFERTRPTAYTRQSSFIHLTTSTILYQVHFNMYTAFPTQRARNDHCTTSLTRTGGVQRFGEDPNSMELCMECEFGSDRVSYDTLAARYLFRTPLPRTSNESTTVGTPCRDCMARYGTWELWASLDSARVC